MTINEVFDKFKEDMGELGFELKREQEVGGIVDNIYTNGSIEIEISLYAFLGVFTCERNKEFVSFTIGGDWGDFNHFLDKGEDLPAYEIVSRSGFNRNRNSYIESEEAYEYFLSLVKDNIINK